MSSASYDVFCKPAACAIHIFPEATPHYNTTTNQFAAPSASKRQLLVVVLDGLKVPDLHICIFPILDTGVDIRQYILYAAETGPFRDMAI
jgi:hypothetical protein